MSEYARKLKIIRNWMTEHNVGGLYLQSVGSFAWATCGAASYINSASTNGLAALLVTQDHQYLVTTNIEAPRLEVEEHLSARGWESVITAWHESHDAIADLSRGLRLASDGYYPGVVDLSAELARLRAKLTPEEGNRFRDLGGLCAQAMQTACELVKPGDPEYEIAARLGAEGGKAGRSSHCKSNCH